MRDPIADLLDELSAGPRNFYDLEDRLIELGHDLGDDPDATLGALIEASDRIVELDDATVLDSLTLLSGVTFSADFSESHDLLDHQVDLTLVELAAEAQLPLTIDGEDTGIRTHDRGYRLHHQRWLHLTDPDHLTGFTIGPDGLEVTTQLLPAPELDETGPIPTMFREVAKRIGETNVPVELEPLLMELAATGVFTGLLPPITHLLREAGLESENMMVVVAGFDWDAWLDAQAEEFEAEYGADGGVL